MPKLLRRALHPAATTALALVILLFTLIKQGVGPFDIGIILIFVILALVSLWQIPEYLANRRPNESQEEAKGRVDRENSARSAIGQILAGAAALVGIYFLWGQLEATNATLRQTQIGQTVESFTTAVDQLESDRVSTRIGGVFALEQIGRDPLQIWPALQVLSAHMRSIAPWPSVFASPSLSVNHSQEAQIVLASISKLGSTVSLDGASVDLHGTDLRGLSLEDVKLPRINLRGSNLDDAKLSRAILNEADLRPLGATFTSLAGAKVIDADLSGASMRCTDLHGSDTHLVNTQLQRADLTQANLNAVNLADANLSGAVLTGADLRGANLTRTDLTGATLSGAFMQGTDLSGAIGVTADQLAFACTDADTVPPRGISTRVRTSGCESLSTDSCAG